MSTASEKTSSDSPVPQKATEESGRKRKRLFFRRFVRDFIIALLVAFAAFIVGRLWERLNSFMLVRSLSVAVEYEKNEMAFRKEENKLVVSDKFNTEGGTKRWHGKTSVPATDGWAIVSGSIKLRVVPFGSHGAEAPEAHTETELAGSFTVNWAYTAAEKNWPRKRNAGILVYADYTECRPQATTHALPAKDITTRGEKGGTPIYQLDRDAKIKSVTITMPDKSNPIILTEAGKEQDGLSYSVDPKTGEIRLAHHWIIK